MKTSRNQCVFRSLGFVAMCMVLGFTTAYAAGFELTSEKGTSLVVSLPCKSVSYSQPGTLVANKGTANVYVQGQVFMGTDDSWEVKDLGCFRIPVTNNSTYNLFNSTYNSTNNPFSIAPAWNQSGKVALQHKGWKSNDYLWIIDMATKKINQAKGSLDSYKVGEELKGLTVGVAFEPANPPVSTLFNQQTVYNNSLTTNALNLPWFTNNSPTRITVIFDKVLLKSKDRGPVQALYGDVALAGKALDAAYTTEYRISFGTFYWLIDTTNKKVTRIEEKNVAFNSIVAN